MLRHALAADPRLPAAAVAQSLPALADRDLLGSARRPHHLRGFLAVCVETRRELLRYLRWADRMNP